MLKQDWKYLGGHLLPITLCLPLWCWWIKVGWDPFWSVVLGVFSIIAELFAIGGVLRWIAGLLKARNELNQMLREQNVVNEEPRK